MNDVLAPGLAFVSVVCIGGAMIITRHDRRRRIQQRLEEGPIAPPPLPVETGKLLEAVSFIGSRVGAHKSIGLKEQLAKAGLHHPAACHIYMGAKVLLLGLALLLGALAMMPLSMSMATKITVTLMLATIMFFLPNVVIAMRRRRRLDQIERHLPNGLDLLEICVSSGMGMDMAWNSVAHEMRNVAPVLADEMALTNLEIHLGAPRSIAMRHMAVRTGCQDLASLVTILVQSDRFGTSISTALRTFSESMREQRSQRAQEQAEKMAVKLLFPMVLLIFPAVLVVLVGPAGIILSDVLGK